MSPFKSEIEHLRWRIERRSQILADSQGDHDEVRLERLLAEDRAKLQAILANPPERRRGRKGEGR